MSDPDNSRQKKPIRDFFYLVLFISIMCNVGLSVYMIDTSYQKQVYREYSLACQAQSEVYAKIFNYETVLADLGVKLNVQTGQVVYDVPEDRATRLAKSTVEGVIGTGGANE